MHRDYIINHISLWLATKSAHFKREVHFVIGTLQVFDFVLGTLKVPMLLTQPNTHESIYLRSSYLNMYTFFPKIIHPYTITSQLLRVRCKVVL